MIPCHLADAHCGSHLVLLHVAPPALDAAGVKYNKGHSSYCNLMSAYEQSCFAVPLRFLRQVQKAGRSAYVATGWRGLSEEEVKGLPPRNVGLLGFWMENKRKLEELDRLSSLHISAKKTIKAKSKPLSSGAAVDASAKSKDALSSATDASADAGVGGPAIERKTTEEVARAPTEQAGDGGGSGGGAVVRVEHITGGQPQRARVLDNGD